jgi:hypothetical protein
MTVWSTFGRRWAALPGVSAAITLLGVREKLTAARTYYVRTDGSDSNTGLVNDSGGAFLTKQKAYDVITGTLDLGGYTVTVQVGAGTYTGGLLVSQPWTGGGAVTFTGDTTTPANVLVSRTSATCVETTASLPGVLTVQGFEFRTTTSGSAVIMAAPGVLTLGNNRFGACNDFHIRATGAGANIVMNSAYSITGGTLRHYDIEQGATLTTPSATVTLTGTFTFTLEFCYATLGGTIQAGFSTYSGGTITGQRYDISLNAAVSVAGGGASFFPGSIAGATATGGQYA